MNNLIHRRCHKSEQKIQAVLQHLLAAAYYGVVKSQNASYEQVSEDVESKFTNSHRAFVHLQPFLWDGTCLSNNVPFLPVELKKSRRNPLLEWYTKKHWDYWIEHLNEYNDTEGYTADDIQSEVQKDLISLNFDSMFGVDYALEYPNDPGRLQLLVTLIKAALSIFEREKSGNLFYARSSTNKRLQGVTGKSTFLRYVLSLLKAIGPFLILPGIELKANCCVESPQEFYAEIFMAAENNHKKHVLELILLQCPTFEFEDIDPAEPAPSVEMQFNTLAIEYETQHLILKKLGENAWEHLALLHNKLIENIHTEYFHLHDPALPSDEVIGALLDPENTEFIDTESVVPSTFDITWRISLLKFIWFRANITVYNSPITVRAIAT